MKLIIEEKDLPACNCLSKKDLKILLQNEFDVDKNIILFKWIGNVRYEFDAEVKNGKIINIYGGKIQENYV